MHSSTRVPSFEKLTLMYSLVASCHSLFIVLGPSRANMRVAAKISPAATTPIMV